MKKEEFQLRYMGYEYMSERFNLGWDESTLIKLADRTEEGKITKKLTEVSPEELKKATLESYTDFKKDFLEKFGDKKIKTHTLKDYITRLEYELKVINQMGYDTYFLIVQDYIMYAKKNKIVVGPGRGSAAGSLLSYLIRITEIDPLDYDLLFERFLNPARVSMPDIDTDFEDTERENILEYCKRKYGVEKVSNIGTYMSMAAKASFKDVARVFGVSFTKSNSISANIEKSIEKSYNENEEFKKIVDEDETLTKVVKFASKLEGTARQLGVHACGVIIAPENIDNYSPIQYPPKPGSKEPDFSRIVTQYDGHYLEDIGLLKMDFLGLRNLSIIKNTIKIVKKKAEKEGKKIDSIYGNFFKYYVFEPNINDKQTYKIFQEGDTVGVFQFESDGMRAWLKKLKPESINDIIAMVALYRPGPMEWIPNYIDRKSGKEKITYLPQEVYDILVKNYGKEVADKQKEMIRKDLSPFMDITYGIPIYQEQLMRIVQAMAGFSLGEADLLRRGVGKKIKEVIEKLKGEFIERAENIGYKKEVSLFVYEKMIEPASNYSFNKSHAACYAIIAYQTAYLKAYQPVAFYAALLRSVEENTDRFAELVEELKIKGLKILPVNINTSFNHIAAVKDAVVIGFLAIKGIGYEVGEFIQKDREKNGVYKDLEDFLTRTEKYINKKTIEALIYSGALDCFEERSTLIANIDTILEWTKQSKKKQETVGMGLFGDDILGKEHLKLKKAPKLTKIEKLELEYKAFGTFISSNPFDGLYNYIKRKYNLSTQIKDENYEGDFKIMGFITSINKTRYGGFSVHIEDIVGRISFYLKTTKGLNLFDVIVLEGRKAKRISVKKIFKINLDKLIEKLKEKGKFDENETVAKIRLSRADANDKIKEKSVNFNDNNKNTLPEDTIDSTLLKKENLNDDLPKKQAIQEDRETVCKKDNKDCKTLVQSKVKEKNYNFNKETKYQEVFTQLPEDIDTIDKIIEYKRNNPDKIEIVVDGNIYLL